MAELLNTSGFTERIKNLESYFSNNVSHEKNKKCQPKRTRRRRVLRNNDFLLFSRKLLLKFLFPGELQLFAAPGYLIDLQWNVKRPSKSCSWEVGDGLFISWIASGTELVWIKLIHIQDSSRQTFIFRNITYWIMELNLDISPIKLSLSTGVGIQNESS